MLTDLEAVFRGLKSELGLRPMYHHKEERTEGHLFITVLAYQLVQAIRRKMAAAGETMSLGSIPNAYGMPASAGRVLSLDRGPVAAGDGAAQPSLHRPSDASAQARRYSPAAWSDRRLGGLGFPGSPRCQSGCGERIAHSLIYLNASIRHRA